MFLQLTPHGDGQRGTRRGQIEAPEEQIVHRFRPWRQNWEADSAGRPRESTICLVSVIVDKYVD